MLGENPQTIRENAGILLEASKEIGLKANPEKTKYRIMSRDENIVRNGNIKIGNLSFEEVEKFKISFQQQKELRQPSYYRGASRSRWGKSGCDVGKRTVPVRKYDSILKALSSLENANIFLERTILSNSVLLTTCGLGSVWSWNFLSRRGGSEVHSKTQTERLALHWGGDVAGNLCVYASHFQQECNETATEVYQSLNENSRETEQEDRDITYALFCSVLCIMEQVLFDEILILKSSLYDKRRSSYKDEKMEENTWLSIAASLNTDREIAVETRKRHGEEGEDKNNSGNIGGDIGNKEKTRKQGEDKNNSGNIGEDIGNKEKDKNIGNKEKTRRKEKTRITAGKRQGKKRKNNKENKETRKDKNNSGNIGRQTKERQGEGEDKNNSGNIGKTRKQGKDMENKEKTRITAETRKRQGEQGEDKNNSSNVGGEKETRKRQGEQGEDKNNSEHITNANHTYRDINTDVEILHIQSKSQKLNTLEQYELHRHTKTHPNEILNTQLNFRTRTLFDSTLHYTKTPPQKQKAPRPATTSSEEGQ
ncbi:hypothetical protein ANN_09101 [Periplaneta americana]|uniref:Uncharacterized protein n=1 Tax=Periplaneta americana TaxID=6978 RepID=A0ABQ8TKF4_PERAM|nr:hypothetical protein ANN_09101 [Periplaneta americana]